MSIASEAPIFFVIMRREKAHHIRSRRDGSRSREIDSERAANWTRLVASNQYLTKAFVSSSAPCGYALASRMLCACNLAFFKRLDAFHLASTRAAFVSHDRAISTARG